MLKKVLDPLIAWYMATLKVSGYWLIALLNGNGKLHRAAAERGGDSACCAFGVHRPDSAQPLWHCHRRDDRLLAWCDCHVLGRPACRTTAVFLRYGKWILITPEKIEGAERWADHYGSMGIFISRLLPVVRHLIGIPAGVVKMDYKLFSLFTLLGSAVWCAVLCYVGVKMGQDEKLMKGELTRISIWLGGGMLVLGGLYYFAVHRQMKRREP